jgi:pyruvate ferredoxin oxidoreductase gamma subunit/2-oxoisovalerate ferredoxin oxidoreductase gamma subunit
MMGAFARMLETPPMEAVCNAIRDEVPSEPEANIAAAREANEEVILLGEI